MGLKEIIKQHTLVLPSSHFKPKPTFSPKPHLTMSLLRATVLPASSILARSATSSIIANAARHQVRRMHVENSVYHVRPQQLRERTLLTFITLEYAFPLRQQASLQDRLLRYYDHLLHIALRRCRIPTVSFLLFYRIRHIEYTDTQVQGQWFGALSVVPPLIRSGLALSWRRIRKTRLRHL